MIKQHRGDRQAVPVKYVVLTGQPERKGEKYENRFWLLLLSAVLVFRGTAVYADVADYQTVTQEEQKENKTIQTLRQTMDRAIL